ncbi:MAG: 3-oxoacyl-ACP reductase FabG [Clostridiales bacterium]|jgi:3-oxoacyl-[acyl-carrier protein] reductase|nr:3-oxoacyl-ACP reductase FabG [Clostridiales bacterium]
MECAAEMAAPAVLVTGSSRGIGLAIARRFARANYQVAFNCLRRQPEMHKAIDSLRKDNPHLLGAAADVSDYERAADLFAQIHQTFGGLDILVNNAGAEYFGLFQDMRPLDWENIVRTNLFSVFNCCRLAIPDMVARKKGVILNISSVWGTAGASCEAVYAASKGAVNAFTKSLAKELGPSGVRVNAIACGVMETDMNARLTPEEKEAAAENVPLARFGMPEEAADLAFYLASDQASYLTGQVVNLDGGWM